MYVLYFLILVGFAYGVYKLIDKYITVEKVKKAQEDVNGKISIIRESRKLIQKKRTLAREKKFLEKEKEVQDLEEELLEKD